ncbi:hypothetical protein [Bacillus alkalicellulosilyticus]|uniref:hypothetical protein n=1 Tax=Alkalihalobacterium alkalicellulosilyticum TaxID=1912214 RepID=UPI0014834D62|nr:hypothetical protein [Bacillus alkalicellulosilyticus]
MNNHETKIIKFKSQQEINEARRKKIDAEIEASRKRVEAIRNRTKHIKSSV